MEPRRKHIFPRAKLAVLLCWLACWLGAQSLVWGAGSLNGVAVTAWNGVAFTSWNGTSISAAGGGGNTVTIVQVGTGDTDPGSFTSQNPSITVPSGSNRALFLVWGGGRAASPGTFNTPTSNQGGTFVKVAEVLLTSGWGMTTIWVMTAPAVATHSVTLATTSGAGFSDGYCNLIAMTGVDQTTPTEAAVVQVNSTGSAITAPSSGSMTVGTGGLALAVCASDSEGQMTATAGTAVSGFPILNINSDTSVGCSTRNTTGSITWSTTSNPCSISGVVVRAAP